ncbi:hypothetical protein DTO207G8_758 [Paecilomyces variotii]|nr:hypothetical protein DTO207G8_758 [Paecilomyces variotii]
MYRCGGLISVNSICISLNTFHEYAGMSPSKTPVTIKKVDSSRTIHSYYILVTEIDGICYYECFDDSRATTTQRKTYLAQTCNMEDDMAGYPNAGHPNAGYPDVGGPGGPAPEDTQGQMEQRPGAGDRPGMDNRPHADPEGKCIELLAGYTADGRAYPAAAVSVPFTADPQERQRVLEDAMQSREDQRGLGGSNPYVEDHFIPESFKQWLRDDGKVVFEEFEGRKYTRALPLGEAILRFLREKRGRGLSDGEIRREAQGRTLLNMLRWLGDQGEPTYLDYWSAMTSRIRERGRIRQAENRMQPARYRRRPPPHPPHLFGGDMPMGEMDPRMGMDPGMFMGMGYGGAMPPPPPPPPLEYFRHAREHRRPRRPSFPHGHGYGPSGHGFHGGWPGPYGGGGAGGYY